MDYETNFGNIKKILRLWNLLGASEVLPAYLVCKKKVEYFAWNTCSSHSGISVAIVLYRGIHDAPP